jgi:hypothetical protein
MAVLLLAAAGLPWLGGVPATPAILLGLLAAAALPAAWRGVPGPWCAVRGLGGGPDQLLLLPDGGPATPRRATRVLPGLVLLAVETRGRRRTLWIPRSAMPAGDFRRLKVALRAGRGGVGPAP